VKVIPLVVETRSYLRVGGGGVYFDFASSDNPVAKVRVKVRLEEGFHQVYVPFIPGSSFRGVLRSTYEVYLRREKEVEGVWRNGVPRDAVERFLSGKRKRDLRVVIDELKSLASAGLLDGDVPSTLSEFDDLGEDDPVTDEIRDSLVSALERYFELSGFNVSLACFSTSELDRCENPALLSSTDRVKLREDWNHLTGRVKYCRVCRAFGAPGLRSAVKITAFIPVDPFPIYLERMVHVAVDRLTGAAAEEKLFDEELVPVGTRFLGFAVVLDEKVSFGGVEEDVLSTVREALDVLAMKAERGEVSLGGRGSAGYGLFTLRVGGVEGFPLALDGLIRGEYLFRMGEGDGEVDGDVVNALGEFFPKYLLSSVKKISKEPGEVVYEVVDDAGRVIMETKSEDELSSFIKRGYRFRVKGALTL
jgi:CRISPR/Cas system CSM-associated protein Csm3 (group 7 of RAMP superfamily)